MTNKWSGTRRTGVRSRAGLSADAQKQFKCDRRGAVSFAIGQHDDEDLLTGACDHGRGETPNLACLINYVLVKDPSPSPAIRKARGLLFKQKVEPRLFQQLLIAERAVE